MRKGGKIQDRGRTRRSSTSGSRGGLGRSRGRGSGGSCSCSCSGSGGGGGGGSGSFSGRGSRSRSWSKKGVEPSLPSLPTLSRLLSALLLCHLCILFWAVLWLAAFPLHAIPTPPRPTLGSRGGWGLVAYCRELRPSATQPPPQTTPQALWPYGKVAAHSISAVYLSTFSPKKHVPHPTLPRWVRMRMKGEDGECSNSDKNEDENHHRTSTGRGV